MQLKLQSGSSKVKSNIVVLKFGGKTLNTKENIQVACSYVNRLTSDNYKVICVVSAMGRKGDPYATDTLKSLVKNTLENQLIDRLLACGEIISSLIFDSFLREKGVKSRALNIYESGIITDNIFGDANILKIHSRKIKKFLNKYNCLVIPGFLGKNKVGCITTLGRGGSDTTAIALADKLKAEKAIIISDVEGVLSGDPKYIVNPYFYDQVDQESLYFASLHGGNFIHHKAAEIIFKKNINVEFTSIQTLGQKYTRITNRKNSSVIVTYKDISDDIYKVTAIITDKNKGMLCKEIYVTKDYFNEKYQDIHHIYTANLVQV